MTPKDVLFISYIGAFLAVVSVLFLAFVAYVAYQGVDRLHGAIEDRDRRREEPAADRPPYDGIDGATAVAMAGWCCDGWAATAGAEHSPECRNHRRSSTT